MGRRARLRQAAAALVAACLGIVGMPTVAAANPLSTADRAYAIMRLSYEQFATTPHNRPFDWSADGCSVPSHPIELPRYKDDFKAACNLHDFGYRNFGGQGLRLSPSEETREWIDRRFLDEMNRICAPMTGIAQFGKEKGDECRSFARTYFKGVRDYGGSSFF